jgi:hypothetical protein
MSSSSDKFDKLESASAHNFVRRINNTNVQQVILVGIVNEDSLSKHLASRKNVETILNTGTFPTTTLSRNYRRLEASFEIIRDLVNKLPIMIAPKWLNTRCPHCDS